MKLTKKSELGYVDGYIVDPAGDILALSKLADEVNELVEMLEFIEFLKINASDIRFSSEPVVYKPVRDEAPVIKTDKTYPTPLLDEAMAQAEARAEEFLDSQMYKDADQHLLKYRNLARWFANEHIVVQHAETMPAKFKVNVLTWTQDDVTDIVESWFDPDITKLRGMVKIDFSS